MKGRKPQKKRRAVQITCHPNKTRMTHQEAMSKEKLIKANRDYRPMFIEDLDLVDNEKEKPDYKCAMEAEFKAMKNGRVLRVVNRTDVQLQK